MKTSKPRAHNNMCMPCAQASLSGLSGKVCIGGSGWRADGRPHGAGAVSGAGRVRTGRAAGKPGGAKSLRIERLCRLVARLHGL